MAGMVIAAAAAGAAAVKFTRDESGRKWTLPTPERADMSPESLASRIAYHSKYTVGSMPKQTSEKQLFMATASAVRENLIDRWDKTYQYIADKQVKQACYLSMEYLQGRALTNAVGNMGLICEYGEALKQIGYEMEELAEEEPDAGLGNGGLGRLASCFLDSMATLSLPCWGYGLRYKYGLFKQTISSSGQTESADNWLDGYGNPWEIRREEVSYPVRFYGAVDDDGVWTGGDVVDAIACDMPIPGFGTQNTISLRLWDIVPTSTQLDLDKFNAGDHNAAQETQRKAAELCYVLYPGDDSDEGKELRLKQQYLLSSASVQDVLARFQAGGRSPGKRNWDELPKMFAIQMNDTHPTLAAPELMRLLVDEHDVSWDRAWKITSKVVAYTNHTVMPEALERWSKELMTKLLPRHVEIIERIDSEFIAGLVKTRPASESDEDFNARVTNSRILENEPLPWAVTAADAVEEATLEKDGDADAEEDTDAVEDKEEEEEEEKPVLVRMANICVISAFAVNGVAAIHSEIVKRDTFSDFYQLTPEKFQNKTNGVTPRRWLRWCNPALSAVITKWLGSESWVTNADELQGLRAFAESKELQAEWRAAKVQEKAIFAKWVKRETGLTVRPDVMFDIQIKRIHEYKRQLLNILGVVHRYMEIKAMTPAERREVVPRFVAIGGKAFATYTQAKRIVKLITAVADVVNADSDVGDLLKVCFLPNYRVTVCEKIVPASDLSQHISTAGTEASGTSNMKFAMNGCLIIGTYDGANIEIREEIGEENFFLFGCREEEVPGLRADRAAGKYVPDPRFTAVKDYIRSGAFGSDEDVEYNALLGSLEGNEGFGCGDYFLVGHDFASYLDAQAEVDKAWKDQDGWMKSSILSTAGSGKFSSDRTIQQYADEIWGIKPCVVPNDE